MSAHSSPSHSSDSSLALTPEKMSADCDSKVQIDEQHSSISEHISVANSFENDRSLLEIEISNVPDEGESPPQVALFDLINCSPPSSMDASSARSAVKNVQSVLNEILHSEQFCKERTDRSDYLDSSDEVSLNIFDGVHLDDDSISNYVHTLKMMRLDGDDALPETPKIRSLEDALSAKDSIIQALNVEIESLKDTASHPSTLSLSATLTEYKQMQEECAARFVQFEDAIAHRDGIICQLKDSLSAAQQRQDDLRNECEQYSKDVQCLQLELVEATEYMRARGMNSIAQQAEKRTQDFDVVFAKLGGVLRREHEDILLEIKREVQDELGRQKAKHAKEMDEARKYYEKNLSDELATQNTLSKQGSNEDAVPSEDEMPDIYAGGDNRITAPDALTSRAVQKLKQQADRAQVVLSKYDMDTLGQEALNAIQSELGSLKLSTMTMQDMQRDYEERIAALQKLAEEKDLIEVATQADSGDYEIDGIIKSYQVQLSEQVARAKFDILSSLEDTIAVLAASDCGDNDWPKEFLEIRNKLSARYMKEISNLQQAHADELSRLKEEHLRALDTAVAPGPCGRSDISATYDANESKTSKTLRNLLIESYKYFARCEEELNATLFDELAKATADSGDTSTSGSSPSPKGLETPMKRVHLTPNIDEYMQKIDSNRNVSLDFKHELTSCLDRLRADANAILALTCRPNDAPGKVSQRSPDDHRMLALQEQAGMDQQRIEELQRCVADSKQYVQSLESECGSLGKQLADVIGQARVTEAELQDARNRIAQLIEYGRKEVVSEGFGESQSAATRASRTSFIEVLDRARQYVVEHKGDASAMQVVEELARECDQLASAAKRDRQDFLQQIESADKKLKATQQFLEEQAVEREQERDESTRAIRALSEQLRSRHKDRAGFERINQEVEGFEQQMHDMSKLIADTEKRFQTASGERAEAVEKISLLRDIIKDLEAQVEAKQRLEQELKALVSKQRATNEELLTQLEAANNTTSFQTQILQLEEEVARLRRASDIVGNEGLIRDIQIQLHDIELSVDRNIRECEALYATKPATTCSTPSEEMSVQDQIRPKTPNSASDDCEVPLLQLARLKEKLLRHSRAEHATVKRIQDLEMQVMRGRQEQDEVRSERDVLQEQVAEQLVLISSLQIRLDDQRLRAEHIQKQVNSSLEARIYDLEGDLRSLRDKLAARDNTIKQLRKVIDETSKRLRDREEELSAVAEESAQVALQTDLEKMRAENQMLRLRIESDATSAQILPSLVDNIIADKNKDIEGLRVKLQEAEQLLELMKTRQRAESGEESKSSLRLFHVSSPDAVRSGPETASPSVIASSFLPEISSIQPTNERFHYMNNAPLMPPNSTELHKSTEKRVHFQDETLMKVTIELDSLNNEIQFTKRQLQAEIEHSQALRLDVANAQVQITDKETELRLLHDDLKRKDELCKQLLADKNEFEEKFYTLDAIRKQVEAYHCKETELQAQLQEARAALEEKQASITELQKEFDDYKYTKDISYHERLSNELAAHSELNMTTVDKLNRTIQEQRALIQSLNECVAGQSESIHRMEQELKAKSQTELQFVLHKKELSEKNLEAVKLRANMGDLQREILQLQDAIREKERLIDAMKVDSETLRVSLATIKSKMMNQQVQVDAGGDDELGDRVHQLLHASANLDDLLLNALTSGRGNERSIAESIQEALDAERQAKAAMETRVKDLELKLADSSAAISRLSDALRDQKQIFEERQNASADMLQQIEAKLGEALISEVEYKAALSNERAQREQLESQLATLQKKESASTTTLTDYKSIVSTPNQRMLNELTECQHHLLALKREVKFLKKAKQKAETGLHCLKELLDAKQQEIERGQQTIAARNDEVQSIHSSMLTYRAELEVKQREVKNCQALMHEMEQEKNQLNVQIAFLQTQHQWKGQNTLEKMNEITDLVTKHINQNKISNDLVLKLTAERDHLLTKLQRMELEGRDQLQVPFDDAAERANHLFAKYLRADSYRNALAFQKKYLISILSTYQERIAPALSTFEAKRKHVRRNSSHRFRSMVVVCIAIFRMKYMVQRWHSGPRYGAYLGLQKKCRTAEAGANFQVGQPVSGEHFRLGGHMTRGSAAQGRSATEALQPAIQPALPWVEQSPPIREAAARGFQLPAEGRVVFEDPSTGDTPRLFNYDEYLEKFNLIQQRLSMALSSMQQ